jgi:hypothetical protein
MRILGLAALFFLLFPNAAPAAEEGEWNELGNGWKVMVISIEEESSLRKAFGGEVHPEGEFLVVEMKTQVTPEAYKKKVLLVVDRDTTFVVGEDGEKHPMCGCFMGGTYMDGIVGRGIRGPENLKLVFDVPEESPGLKLLLMPDTPMIRLSE